MMESTILDATVEIDNNTTKETNFEKLAKHSRRHEHNEKIIGQEHRRIAHLYANGPCRTRLQVCLGALRHPLLCRTAAHRCLGAVGSLRVWGF